MAASSSWEFEVLAQELIHGVAFSVTLCSGVQRAGRSDDVVRLARSSAGKPAVDNSCVGLTALDIELVRLVAEVLVESINCTVCGAQLDRAVNVQLRRGYFNAARIIIATHCRGRRRHRHMARVVETAGHLYLGTPMPGGRDVSHRAEMADDTTRRQIAHSAGQSAGRRLDHCHCPRLDGRILDAGVVSLAVPATCPVASWSLPVNSPA
jgi:hypothetical protein